MYGSLLFAVSIVKSLYAVKCWEGFGDYIYVESGDYASACIHDHVV